jgi:hypothetical protein
MIHARLGFARERHDDPVNERERRIGENEVIFREVNERVRETHETFDVNAGEAEFVCECGTTSCVERVRMTLAEYEQARAEPTQFVIVPGHEASDIEIVLRREPGFWVVRKRAGEAEELALETDPRR